VSHSGLARLTIELMNHSNRVSVAALLAEEVDRGSVLRYDLDLGDAAFPVVLGAGVWDQLETLIPPSWSRVVIVTQAAIPGSFELPFDATWVVLPSGESAKRPGVAEGLAERLVRLGADRQTGLVAVGGGVVTDLVGFVASTYMRGIEYLNAPTTLLGMVDAAIGGKTAVNLMGGKNLFGTFWQPQGLLCDLALLQTLPQREWLSGAGELAKYSFLTSDPFAELKLVDQIVKAQRLKESYVAGDEREAGRRSLLNYGHTLGHGIEGAYLGRGMEGSVSHGEAVAVGLVFAARLAARLGRIDQDRVDQHHQVLASYGLDFRLPGELTVDEVLSYMRADKKNRGGMSFVLDGSNGLELVHHVDEALIRQVLEEYPRREGVSGRS
jgi:5-deoxy-5-amino-3-dehydroquinate synthase